MVCPDARLSSPGVRRVRMVGLMWMEGRRGREGKRVRRITDWKGRMEKMDEEEVKGVEA